MEREAGGGLISNTLLTLSEIEQGLRPRLARWKVWDKGEAEADTERTNETSQG